jgi:hypothetical protein
MPFFVELGAGIAASLLEKQLEKNSGKFITFAKELKERTLDGSLGIFIFGPQGTGKTTALGILSGEKEVNDVPSEYISSAKNEVAKYKGHLFFKVYAGPGQTSLSDVHWPDLYKKVGEFDRSLCIFCASYGCHAIFEEDFEALQTSSMNTKDSLVVKDYLEGKRQLEARLFSEFCTQISGVAGKLGLMLLVTKQDLWWAQRQGVAAHYSRGAFASGFRRLSDAKRAAGFVKAQQSASLSLQNLLTSDRQLLVPTTAGYDQLLQRVNYLALLRKLEEMVAALAEN